MKYLILSTISLSLIACSGAPSKPPEPQIQVVTEYVYPDCGNPPQRHKVEHREIFWDYKLDEDGDVVYTLTPQGYEDLSFNVSEIIKGIKQLKGEIAYYKDCIKAIDK